VDLADLAGKDPLIRAADLHHAADVRAGAYRLGHPNVLPMEIR
jgi:hypothetical protein